MLRKCQQKPTLGASLLEVDWIYSPHKGFGKVWLPMAPHLTLQLLPMRWNMRLVRHESSISSMILREWPPLPHALNEDCCRLMDIELCKESPGFKCYLYNLRKLFSLILSFLIEKQDNNVSLPDCGEQMKYRDVSLRKISKCSHQCKVWYVEPMKPQMWICLKNMEALWKYKILSLVLLSFSKYQVIYLHNRKEWRSYPQVQAWAYHVQRICCKRRWFASAPPPPRNVSNNSVRHRVRQPPQGPSCHSYYR